MLFDDHGYYLCADLIFIDYGPPVLSRDLFLQDPTDATAAGFVHEPIQFDAQN